MKGRGGEREEGADENCNSPIKKPSTMTRNLVLCVI